MIQTAFLLTFVIGAFMGALLMALTALVRSEQLRKQETERANKAEAKLQAIHEKHVRAGKARHLKQRARILTKAAEMRAEMENNNVVQMSDAA